ncbi:MAG: hypothetical protein CVT60_04770 [Actinobacteria bacterium HGW-Actinobacteria-10]|jgi:hypothetical protein|nr:MAG: hypothetical protein CVT60_04770 [Actinobacteria bacterium HGW-Actinobacteria-10]
MTPWIDAIRIDGPVVWGIIVWLVPAWVLGRRLRWTVPAVLAAAFALAIAGTGVGAVTAWALGETLSVAIKLTVAVAALVGVAAWLLPRTGSVRPGGQGIVLGILAGWLAAYQRPWFEFGSDVFYHLAAARSLLATNAPLVTDPLHRSGVTSIDPTSGVFHTWLALVSRLSDTPAEPEYVFAGFSALAAAAVVWAFWGLAERVSNSSWAATTVTLGFAALRLFGDFRAAGLPNRFTVAYLCIALLALLDSTDRDPVRRRAAIVVAFVGGMAAALTHLAAAGALAVFLISGLAVYALFGRMLRGADSSAPSPFALTGTLLVVGAVIWGRAATVFSSPMGEPPRSLPDAFVSLGRGMFVIKPGAYVGGGPVAFVVMGLIGAGIVWLAIRKRDGFVMTIGAFVLVPVMLLAIPPIVAIGVAVSTYMYARIALMMGFVPFLAIAWALTLNSGGRRYRGIPAAWKHVAVASGVFMLLAYSVLMWPQTYVTFVSVPDKMRNGEAYTVNESRLRDIRASWGMPTLSAVGTVVSDDYPVVAASPMTGYYLAGLANIAVVAAPQSHSPLAVETVDGPERRDDMARLLDVGATEPERRSILARRDADFVALWLGPAEEIAAWESMRAQTDLFRIAVRTKHFVLLRVVDDA